MTMEELKRISDQCPDDAVFLSHPDVRRVWWECIEPGGQVGHSIKTITSRRWPEHDTKQCVKCEEIWHGYPDRMDVCLIPDPIPGSLPDAVDRLREKVAAVDCDTDDEQTIAIANAVADRHFGICEGFWWIGIDATARNRFLVFAAALGAVEVQP